MTLPATPDDAPLQEEFLEEEEDFALEESSGADLSEMDAPESVKRGGTYDSIGGPSTGPHQPEFVPYAGAV